MNLKKWLKVALLNLLIVAAIGVILRYKIAYSLPFIEQKKLLHGHSHFAFSGWVSQALMSLMVARIGAYTGKDMFKRHNWILWANIICAYGMLIGFLLQGYGALSIFFSTCTLVISYIFMGYMWRDVNNCKQSSITLPWFKAATFFNALSSIGALSLAYMMATKNLHQHWYLAAVYFFLHFQYNGWFSFVVLGLLSEKLSDNGVPQKKLLAIFRLFAMACIPAYFLSALWLPIPPAVYLIVVVSAILQAIGWGWTVLLIKKHREQLSNSIKGLSYNIILLSVIAFSIKFMLQLGSTIPALSTLAFGFRPIVIGYLHLVLLGCISLFILGYSIHVGVVKNDRRNMLGIIVFICGLILNEFTLMVQGIAAIKYIALPYANEILLAIALIMFVGLLVRAFPEKTPAEP